MKLYLKQVLFSVFSLAFAISSASAQSDIDLRIVNQQESTPDITFFQRGPTPPTSGKSEAQAWAKAKLKELKKNPQSNSKLEKDIAKANPNLTNESLQALQNKAAELQQKTEALSKEASSMSPDEQKKKFSDILNESEALSDKMQQNGLAREQGLALKESVQETRSQLKSAKYYRHPLIDLAIAYVKAIKTCYTGLYRIRGAWVAASPKEKLKFLALPTDEKKSVAKEIAMGKHKQSKELNNAIASFKEKSSIMTEKERSEALQSILDKAQTLASESGNEQLLQSIKDAKAKGFTKQNAILDLANRASGAAAWTSSMNSITERNRAKAIAGQYAAASELEKEIAAFNEEAPKMTKAEIEAKMEQILELAQGIADKIKNYPDSEQQRAILKKTIVAAQNTLTGIRNGSITGDNLPTIAKNAIRKLRGPIGQIRAGLASRLKGGDVIRALAAYIQSLRNPNNSIISPEV